MGFEVLDQIEVEVSRQGVDTIHNMVGLATKCRTDAGHVFYVREGLDGASSFHVASNQRLGEKWGSVARNRQVLVLACPDALWGTVAPLVAAADHLGRRVTRNRRFTMKTAAQAFRCGRPLDSRVRFR